MHARLVVGDTVLMGSDAPGERYEKMQGFSVALGVDEPEWAERVFNALAAGGTVTMPIQETFWAHRFGMLVDRFGTPWMVNCEKPM
jgi:PhnB protein